MTGIIDVHAHLSERGDDSLIRYARSNGLSYNLGELLRLMKENGVVKGLLLSPPLRDGSPLPNSKVIELCEKSGGILSPVLTVEPSPKDSAAALKLAKENRQSVKGFKIRLGYTGANAQSRAFQRVYDYAEAESLPVLFHTGDTATSNGSLASSHPLTLDDLANSRENLVIVLCHFGNPWFEDTAELIYKHPNVYADISGLTTGGGGYRDRYMDWLASKLSQAVYFAGGAEKILFGTDYPVTTHHDALELVRRLEIRRRDRDLILRLNARRVFGL